jgi:hypothetical protein
MNQTSGLGREEVRKSDHSEQLPKASPSGAEGRISKGSSGSESVAITKKF